MYVTLKDWSKREYEGGDVDSVIKKIRAKTASITEAKISAFNLPGIPGIGNLFIESIFARDFPIINAVIIIGTTMFVAANLIVDLIYPWLDPRIRLGGSYVA
jgi:peptide/nickel transport system permease protein